MSCKAYTGIPKVYDEELIRTNDIRQIDDLLIPNKKIRQIITVKI